MSSLNTYSDERRFGCNVKYGFTEEGIEEGKLAPGVAFAATHEEIEGLLAAECCSFFERTEGR